MQQPSQRIPLTGLGLVGAGAVLGLALSMPGAAAPERPGPAAGASSVAERAGEPTTRRDDPDQ